MTYLRSVLWRALEGSDKTSNGLNSKGFEADGTAEHGFGKLLDVTTTFLRSESQSKLCQCLDQKEVWGTPNSPSVFDSSKETDKQQPVSHTIGPG